MTTIEVSTFTDPAGDVAVDALLLPVFMDGDGIQGWDDLDTRTGGAIGRALGSRAFTGRSGSTFPVAGDGIAADEILLVGLGKREDLNLDGFRDAMAQAASAATARNAARLAVGARADLDAVSHAAAAAEAIVLGQYRFDRYKPIADDVTVVEELHVEAAADAADAVRSAATVARAAAWARDLVNLSPSDKRPPQFADLVAEMADEVGLKCDVIDEARARELEMGALLAVGRGSSVEPRLVVLDHDPGDSDESPIALVGKGVTFDTGGISIKPSARMHHMKGDMGGAAAVVGTMRAIAELGLPRRVVGFVPMAENMPDGDAYRPGDLVRAMNGKVIEVLNTDAEGRLILADALAYAVREYAPARMVDLATLTGACVVALGDDVAGVMSNDEALQSELVAAGRNVGEAIWPLPMFDEYDKLIESQVGDIKNTGGRGGGAITAAKFLQNFVGDTTWAHLDIAGPAFRTKARPMLPEGGSGFGVRLLVDWLRGDATPR